ncbi:MAG: Rieske 2Fe-2S domain-containing protein [Candidatus Marinimicrobia bacterium]|nr:Rieske 2Fe-2S domain-containing protein [FCB group bacterium]MBL7026606.1 Rieske 2Fe-2S domain-containing protein [Candidatus Neomarinimicrobiota bacterium]
MPEVDFKYACEASDVPENGALNVNLDGVEITIFHTPDRFIARSGVCKHNGFKLELCDITGDTVTCPLHGWKYKISTGKGIKPSWTVLETYPVVMRAEQLWVQPVAKKQDEDFDTSAFDW